MITQRNKEHPQQFVHQSTVQYSAIQCLHIFPEPGSDRIRGQRKVQNQEHTPLVGGKQLGIVDDLDSQHRHRVQKEGGEEGSVEHSCVDGGDVHCTVVVPITSPHAEPEELHMPNGHHLRFEENEPKDEPEQSEQYTRDQHRQIDHVLQKPQQEVEDCLRGVVVVREVDSLRNGQPGKGSRHGALHPQIISEHRGRQHQSRTGAENSATS